MSKQDRAAKAIKFAAARGYTPEQIATLLNELNLIAPDLPEPDRENDREGAEWYLNGQIGYIVGGGPVIEVYCLSHQRQSFRLTFTKEEAEPTALTLLAAAQYAEEE